MEAKEGEGEGCSSLALLVGLRGGLWDLGSDLWVSRVRRPFTAIGQMAATGVALGHLAETRGTRQTPAIRLRAALAAAAELTDRSVAHGTSNTSHEYRGGTRWCPLKLVALCPAPLSDQQIGRNAEMLTKRFDLSLGQLTLPLHEVGQAGSTA